MDNECLICFEDCNENMPCCKKNLHLKCLNSFWQYNPSQNGICPHCKIIINVYNPTINNNIQNVNQSSIKYFPYICSILGISIFVILLSTY
jgi:hypothetical protein